VTTRRALAPNAKRRAKWVLQQQQDDRARTLDTLLERFRAFCGADLLELVEEARAAHHEASLLAYLPPAPWA
jgi:hypothetical protein